MTNPPTKSADAWAAKAAAEIRRLSGRTAADTVRAGLLVFQAKGKLSHGEWLPWVKGLPFSQRTAYKLLRVGVAFGHVKTCTTCNIEVQALYDLSEPSCPAAARAEALRLAERSTRVTADVAAGLVLKYRPPDDPDTPGRMVRGEPSQAVELLRGSLVDHYDTHFERGAFGLILGQRVDEPMPEKNRLLWLALRESETEAAAKRVFKVWGEWFYDEMMAHLFPEVWLSPERQATAPEGVFPNAGPRRVGAARLEAVAGLKAS